MTREKIGKLKLEKKFFDSLKVMSFPHNTKLNVFFFSYFVFVVFDKTLS